MIILSSKKYSFRIEGVYTMSNEIDAELLSAFVFETNSELEELDDILLEAERNHNLSDENINSIFRITHTIKGSAAMIELGSISTLAHTVEDIFYIIRDDPSKLSLIFDALFDLVFKTSDFLKNEMRNLESSQYQPEDPSELIRQLEEQASIMKGEAPLNQEDQAITPSASAPDQSEAPLKEGFQKIRVFFDDDCQMENMAAVFTSLPSCKTAVTSSLPSLKTRNPIPLYQRRS